MGGFYCLMLSDEGELVGFNFMILSDGGGLLVFNFLTLADGNGWVGKKVIYCSDVINGQLPKSM